MPIPASGKVIVAINPFCFSGYDPWVAYKYIPTTGVKYVEVPSLPFSMGAKYDLTTFAPEGMVPGDVELVKGRFDALELVPLTVGAFCDLLDPYQLEALRRRIDFAQQLGAKYVITDASGQPEANTATGRSRLVNALRWIGDYAAERGVNITLETHEGPTRNGKLAREFLKQVDHPNVGVNYDTGNIYYYNDDLDPAEDVKQIADRVTHVHLKDTLGGKGEWKFCALGEGKVNFPAIIEVLRDAGFAGPFSLEVEGEHGEDLNRAALLDRVMRSLDYLRRIGLSWD